VPNTLSNYALSGRICNMSNGMMMDFSTASAPMYMVFGQITAKSAKAGAEAKLQ
jgi:hypothetical protein